MIECPKFDCGEVILYRGLDENGQITDVKPVTVVEIPIGHGDARTKMNLNWR